MIAGRRGLILAWVAVAGLTAALAAANARSSLDRYRDLDSGWSWDLAYYNQWFWALTRGDGVLSVRPQSSYGSEGPSIWRANYLAPIRLLIAPIYAIRPGPETLLAAEAAIFWLVVPAAFLLARGESGSVVVGLTAAALVPLTPVFLPMAANDFRELQLAVPFAPLAIEGLRGRRPLVAALGIGGLLACRQEFGPVVALLALVPPRRPEDLGRSARWARATVLVGVGWTVLFLVYLGLSRSPSSVEFYLAQFGGEHAGLGQTLATLADFLLVGLGAWGVTMLAAPRAAAIAVAIAWPLASGRWALRYLAEEQWHHVRYVAPMAAIGVAAGVLGYARLAARLGRTTPRGWGFAAVAGLAAASAVGLASARAVVGSRWAYAPRPIPAGEVAGLRAWIDRVGPDDGVLADYKVAAPLSSRRVLRSYILTPDRPPDFPTLGPAFQWAFVRPSEFAPSVWTDQGFGLVHRGPTIWVFHRPEGTVADGPPAFDAPLRPAHAAPYWLDDRRFVWVVPGLLAVSWPWLRLRRAWRLAAGGPGGPTGVEAARGALSGLADADAAIVRDAPRDLADPARRSVRLSARTAGSGDAGARTLAAFEAAHLRIALAPGPLGRVARWRTPLVVAARLGTASALIVAAGGLASECLLLLDLGIAGFLAAASAPLIAWPLERLAARATRAGSSDVDPALLAALAWRHVAEAVPVGWRPRG